MINVTEFPTFQSFLKCYLSVQEQKNAQFSLRALARTWKITPSMLSQVMNGKKNFSKQQGLTILEKLNLNKIESAHLKYLLDLALMEKTSSSADRSELKDKIRVNSITAQKTEIELEHFKLISSWYCIPIIEICSQPGSNYSAAEIAQILRISPDQVSKALSALNKLGILKQAATGEYVRIAPLFSISSETKNIALRSFHKAMMEKAAIALEAQAPSERCVGTETFVFSKKYMPEAQAAIRQCFNTLLMLSEKSKSSEDLDLYHIGTQLFRLAEITRKKDVS